MTASPQTSWCSHSRAGVGPSNRAGRVEAGSLRARRALEAGVRGGPAGPERGPEERGRYPPGRWPRPTPCSRKHAWPTPLQDRMGLDHRNALDVAVHPDSPVGRALMEHRRLAGISFIAAGGDPGCHLGRAHPRGTAVAEVLGAAPDMLPFRLMAMCELAAGEPPRSFRPARRIPVCSRSASLDSWRSSTARHS